MIRVSSGSGRFGPGTAPPFFDPDFITDAIGNFPEDFFKRLNETGASALGLLPNLANSYLKMWNRFMPGESIAS